MLFRSYLLFCGGLALTLARSPRAWGAVPVLLPVLPAAGLLLSPVLLDPALLFPALAPLSRLLPVTLYLGACGGHWTDGLLLAAVGAVLMGVPAARDHISSD